MLDPALASMAPTAHLAIEAFGQPPESALESLARLLGLQGEISLRPWIEGETNDIEELARRDYEPAAGSGWRAMWERQLEGSFAILAGQIGPDWPERLTLFAKSDMTHCRQNCPEVAA